MLVIKHVKEEAVRRTRDNVTVTQNYTIQYMMPQQVKMTSKFE